MQGFTDHSVEYVWSLLVRLRLGPISVRDIKLLLGPTPAWTVQYPWISLKFSSLVWFGPYHLVCGRSLVNHKL